MLIFLLLAGTNLTLVRKLIFLNLSHLHRHALPGTERGRSDARICHRHESRNNQEAFGADDRNPPHQRRGM